MSWPAVPFNSVEPVSSAALRQADAAALTRFGIAPLQLMEVAGWQVARFVTDFLGHAAGARVLVVAGSGNNGGDALCAARFLAQRGAAIRVSLVPPRDQESLAAHHGQTLRALGIPLQEAPNGIDAEADLIVDGVFGTGIRPPLRPDARTIVEAINLSGRPVVSVDVPSGMDADDASGAEDAVRASATVTLAAPKAGLRRTPISGRIFLADIGMPPSLFSTAGPSLAAAYSQGDLVELIDPESR